MDLWMWMVLNTAISMFQEGKINQIKCETSKDLTLIKLAKVVQAGWPD